LSGNPFSPSRGKEETGRRESRSWCGVARLMCAASSAARPIGQGGEGLRDQRDLLVSLVGYLLLVAVAVAIIAAVMTGF
jgi:hypothetical protein